jgi:DNA polymerase III subunit epsilon
MPPSSLLRRLLRGRPRVDPMLGMRLHALSEVTPPPIRRSHRMNRYVTVDVETTGIDMAKDRVISIGAVAINGGQIDLSDCFEVVLRQRESSTMANILVHQIGGQQQLAGADPAKSLVRFLEYVRLCPLVAFRADFDRTMLDRELTEVLGLRTQSLWIDLAKLMPALYPSNECRTMDDWLERFGIKMVARHDALADALATAQMLQVVVAAADKFGMDCPARLDEMQRAQQWLGKR